MVEFLIVIIIIVVCVLIFGKADSKRAILNEVGLDLSEKSYENKKEDEFEKYCKKAMKVAVSEYDAKGNNEKDFLVKLEHILYVTLYPRSSYDPDDFYSTPESYNLQVKDHYVKFAKVVVNRRLEELKKGETTALLQNINYTVKQDLKKYIEVLWKKYQYPWPEDWMKKDGFIN